MSDEQMNSGEAENTRYDYFQNDDTQADNVQPGSDAVPDVQADAPANDESGSDAAVTGTDTAATGTPSPVAVTESGADEGKRSSRRGARGDKPAKAEKTDEPRKLGRRASAKGSNPVADAVARRAELDQSNNRREIPTTTYDLLNGKFESATKVRRISLVVVVLSLAIAGVTGFRGVALTIEDIGLRASIQSSANEKARILTQFGTATGLTGVSETQVIERDNLLSDALLDVVKTQPNVARFVDELRTINSNGVVVTKLTISQNEFAPKEKVIAGIDTPASTTSTTSLTGKTAVGQDVKTAPAPTKGVSFTIVAQAAQFENIVAWSESVKGLSLIYEPVFTRQGLKMTITGKVQPDAPGAVAALLAAFSLSVNSGSNASQTTPADATTTVTTGAAPTNTTPATTGGTN